MANNLGKEEKHEQYNPEKWAGKTDMGKRLLIWKFFMVGNEIPEWSLIKAVPEQVREDKKTLTYLWQSKSGKGDELIKIDVVESVSWHRIHEILLQELTGNYEAFLLPDAASRKIEVGDFAYIGFGEVIQSVIFVRANMLVRVHSVGKKNISVIDIANQIDNIFVTKPRLSEKGVIPEIEVLSSDKGVIKANEKVALNVKARDPIDRPLWYKFIVDHGEIFIKDEKVYFLSEATGQPEISLFAVNENGFVSGATLNIKVE
ncbi:MAG: hypothetical protein EPN94_02820 [Nitrospirae bacterium]|nr:MAG: hypothetical protein EPN94_02820 [Nitrospirota bacterium]